MNIFDTKLTLGSALRMTNTPRNCVPLADVTSSARFVFAAMVLTLLPSTRVIVPILTWNDADAIAPVPRGVRDKCNDCGAADPTVQTGLPVGNAPIVILFNTTIVQKMTDLMNMVSKIDCLVVMRGWSSKNCDFNFQTTDETIQCLNRYSFELFVLVLVLRSTVETTLLRNTQVSRFLRKTLLIVVQISRINHTKKKYIPVIRCMK